MSPVEPTLRLRGQELHRSRPGVMAILNLTTDSFYAPARYPDLPSALAAVDRFVEEGADIVDVGAVRAGQEGEHVTAGTEREPLLPVLEAVRSRHPQLLLSVDTWRSEVLASLADVGVDLANDTWAGHDPELVHTAAALGCGVVCSHTGGLPPRTDPVGVSYEPEPLGVVDDVARTLLEGAGTALAAGIPRDRILVDPTLDFGKTTRHSLTLVRESARITELGFPVLQAISRKDFVGETLGVGADERLAGSLAATSVAAYLGAVVFRTHDVRATRHAVDMVASIVGGRPPVVEVRGR